MPHVVFDQKIDLSELQSALNGVLIREPYLIRMTDSFLNKNKNCLLVQTTTIDELHQTYFIEISSGDSKTTIRLYPMTDPQKTNSVKASLALIAKITIEKNNHLQVSKTNISEFL